jgi:hypothetical protein
MTTTVPEKASEQTALEDKTWLDVQLPVCLDIVADILQLLGFDIDYEALIRLFVH